MSHKYDMYKEMCKSALDQTKNSQYIIFKVLSQSKVYKLKHMIKEEF